MSLPSTDFTWKLGWKMKIKTEVAFCCRSTAERHGSWGMLQIFAESLWERAALFLWLSPHKSLSSPSSASSEAPLPEIYKFHFVTQKQLSCQDTKFALRLNLCMRQILCWSFATSEHVRISIITKYDCLWTAVFFLYLLFYSIYPPYIFIHLILITLAFTTYLISLLHICWFQLNPIHPSIHLSPSLHPPGPFSQCPSLIHHCCPLLWFPPFSAPCFHIFTSQSILLIHPAPPHSHFFSLIRAGIAGRSIFLQPAGTKALACNFVSIQ